MTADVTVDFVPLLRRAEDGEWIVGRAPAGPFVALPPVGVEAIDLLAAGATVADAAAELHRRHGEPVDVAAFVEGLSRVGLVAAVAGRVLPPVDDQRTRGATLPWLRADHLRWLPTRTTLAAWVALVAAALAVLIAVPGTRPHPVDLVWADSAAVVTVVDALVLSVVIFLHECAHLALARAYGVPATISVSTRLTFVVAQTDVTGAWVLPRRRRIAIYLVGMALELGLAALAVLALPALSGTPATFLRSLVLTLAFGVLIQFTFYLRTDVFYLIQDLARCRDLYGDSRRLLSHRVGRGTDPRVGRARHERWAVTVYAPLLAVGVLLTLGLFVLVSLPVAVRLTVLAVGDVTSDAVARIVDGVASLAVLGVLYGVLAVVSARKVARGWRRWRGRSPSSGATPAPVPGAGRGGG